MYKLDAAVAFPGAVITILGGCIIYYGQNFPAASSNVWFVLFFVFFVMSSIFWIGSLYYLIRSHTGHEYQLRSNPHAVNEFIAGLRNHYEGADPPPQNVDELVDGDLRVFLINQYQEAATANREKNMERIRWSYRSNVCVVAVLVALALSAAPYILAYERKPQKIEVTDVPAEIKQKAQEPKIYKVEVGPIQLVQPNSPPKP